jgi:agmatine deiminase
MPAETAPQDRIWMAFPRAGFTLGNGTEAEDGYRAWTEVAHAIGDFETVAMVVDPSEVNRARRMLSADIEQIVAPLDDFWMRDIGPTFVVDPDRPGALGAVDWVFNGWGAPAWSQWSRDREIARTVAAAAGAELVSSLLINEGGAIHVDGAGTVLLTETVQLDRGRNPWADRSRIEAELARTIGTTTAIWLPRGLTRDYDELGTRGHVDMIATIPTPGTVLVHDQRNPAHPDFAVSAALHRTLAGATDAAGRPFTIVDLPAPETLTDDTGFVDWSYVNHVVVNGAVIACGYGEPAADSRAAAILAEAYPGRRIVTIDARPILARGGGIHCITQQQPTTSRAAA